MSPLNIIASGLNYNETLQHRRATLKSFLPSLKAESIIKSTFVSHCGVQIVEFKPSSETDERSEGEDVKCFDLTLNSLLPCDVNNVLITWFYSCFDENLLFGNVKGNSFSHNLKAYLHR